MGHGHAHGHGDVGGSNRRALLLTLSLTLTFLVAEVVGGLVTGSLALLADAGHMASDAVALTLALFAAWIASRPATARMTFGYHRAEVLAALANGVGLILVAASIVIEALERLGAPRAIDAKTASLIAGFGLLVNLAALAILRRSSGGGLNLRGAIFHVVADALGSVGAIAANLLIVAFGWRWADSVASIVIAVLILIAAVSLLRPTISVLMESAPEDLDVDAIGSTMCGADGVAGVHDLHVWTLASGKRLVSAHVVLSGDAATALDVVHATRRALSQRFGIDHVTLQPELDVTGDCGCGFGAGLSS